MPEGHAVARWGDALRVLVGDTVGAIQAPPRWRERAQRLVGTQVTGVVTHGKHLVLEFSNDWVIHTHAMQYGSWQIGSPGEALRKDARFIRLRIDTPRHRAVFFHGPVMEVFSREEFGTHERFQSLGPDVLHPEFDVNAVYSAIVAQGDREIGDVVLDQRVLSGIGNVYKSEGLFLAGIDPRLMSSSVPRADMLVFFDEVIPLMAAGRGRPGTIETLPEELRYAAWVRTWVYRRRGQPCFVCATPIQRIRQGAFQRSTYFCPQCQRSADQSLGDGPG